MKQMKIEVRRLERLEATIITQIGGVTCNC
jgi:hypothetical protein